VAGALLYTILTTAFELITPPHTTDVSGGGGGGGGIGGAAYLNC